MEGVGGFRSDKKFFMSNCQVPQITFWIAKVKCANRLSAICTAHTAPARVLYEDKNEIPLHVVLGLAQYLGN